MDTILRISDAANLAIHAMAHIAWAGPGGNHSVGEIAAEQGVSEAHLSKVMQRMVKVGMLRSRRGPGGGFVLARRPEKLPLLEILEAVDGRLVESKCLLGKKKCLYGGCALGSLLTHVNHQVREFMRSSMLSDVMGPAARHEASLMRIASQPATARKKRTRKRA